MENLENYRDNKDNEKEDKFDSLKNSSDNLNRESYSTNKDSRNSLKEKNGGDLISKNYFPMYNDYKIEILNEHYKKFDLNYKLIIVGDIGVGKSCISLKATKGMFIEEYASTVGFEFYCFNVKLNDKVVKLQIWDTCGQEAYRSLIVNFYRNTSLAIIVYSVDDANSFNNVNLWLKHVKTYAAPNCKIFLIGNKIDTGFREVSYEQGLKFKEDFFLDYFMETSAKDGINTTELFVKASTTLYQEHQKILEQIKRKQTIDDNDSVRFSLSKEDNNYEDMDQCNC